MKQNMFAALLFAMLTGMQTDVPKEPPCESQQEQTDTADTIRA